ncbi:MAG: hypothetical protein QMC95_16680 [Desulfitobacteriaceae bacterium]|nr:hypothetical protein [Desulfitobacteriaceae bacterium]
MKIKNLIKLSSIFLTFALLNMSFVQVASAATKPDKILISQTVINEYDKYKELVNKSDETLIKEGHSKEDIKNIRSFDFKAEFQKKVEEKAKLDDDTLLKSGYTKDRIKIIRNYKGTDDQIYALAAQLWLSTYIIDHYKSSTLSYADLRTDWTWTDCPVFLNTDLLAAAWSEGMYYQSNNSYAVANYYSQGIPYTYDNSVTLTVQPNLNTGASVQIPLAQWKMNGNTFAKSGQWGYQISRQALVNELAVKVQYGHNQWSLSPSVQFSPAPSLTFSSGINIEATNDVYIQYM